MHDGTLRLLARRRFLPLFAAQFLGAANDNLFKNAMAFLIVYRLGGQGDLSAALLVTLAAGLFILPYFLFSALAGQIADHHEKSALMRRLKALEVAISVLGAAAMAGQSVAGMMAVLFLLGVQATFYGPVKYAVLPELLYPGELVGGNALVEGGTFLAILLGTIAGGQLALAEGGPVLVGAVSLILAVAGWGASLLVPPAHTPRGGASIDRNPWRASRQVLRQAFAQPEIGRAVLGISWFWLVGATYLSQFPAFGKEVLGVDQHGVTLMLTLFSVGIGLGSVVTARLSKGEVTTRFIAPACLAMAAFGADLWWASIDLHAASVMPLAEFLAIPASWRVLADLLGMAAAGGMFTVPLYTLLQTASAEQVRSQAVAANNIVNAGFMVAGTLAAGALLAAGASIPQLFLLLALGSGVAAYGLRKVQK